jgi:hypothetical protein
MIDEVTKARLAIGFPAIGSLTLATTSNVRFRGESGHDRLRESAFAVAIGGKADVPFCTAYVR